MGKGAPSLKASWALGQGQELNRAEVLILGWGQILSNPLLGFRKEASGLPLG